MATLREELQKLPLQKRLQAIENIRKWNIFLIGLEKTLDMNCIDGCFLIGQFSFSETRQGLDYWYRVYKDHAELKYKRA